MPCGPSCLSPFAGCAHVADSSLQIESKAHPAVSAPSPEIRDFRHPSTSPDEAKSSDKPPLDPWVVGVRGNNLHPAGSKVLKARFLKLCPKSQGGEVRVDRKQGGLCFRCAQDPISADTPNHPVHRGDETVFQRKARHFGTADVMEVGGLQHVEDFPPLTRQWPNNFNFPARLPSSHSLMLMVHRRTEFAKRLSALAGSTSLEHLLRAVSGSLKGLEPKLAEFFVLSLEDCEARRAPLLDALSALGIAPWVVLGVDGRNGLDAAAELLIDRQEVNRRAKRVVTDGELACALSHLAVYRSILYVGCQHAVVLEDDACLTDSFLEAVSALKSQDFDIALLDHEFARSRWSSKFSLPTGTKAWRVTNIPDRNTGYMVTARAARHLLEASFPIRYLADWPVDISTLVTVAVTPKVVMRNEDDRNSLLAKKRILSQARAIWGMPSPPYVDTGVPARLRRFLSRRIS